MPSNCNGYITLLQITFSEGTLSIYFVMDMKNMIDETIWKFWAIELYRYVLVNVMEGGNMV